ncbi:hypothetical protein [Brevibacterium litoralis]|uniref:hypothetical protein n=1 Tax=Brevibacterium litoralis TaxID=3138935 RepID=UPI0032EEDFC7
MPPPPQAPRAPEAPAEGASDADSVPAPESSGTTGESYDGVTFAAFQYGEQPEAVDLTVVPGPGGTRLVWPAADGAGFYRVVFSDAEVPYSPDDAEELTVTDGTDALDRVEPSAAVRYYQVWFYRGEDIYRARLEQPTVHATGTLINAVVDPSVTVDGPQVIAGWRVLPGTRRVHVNRALPREAARGIGRPEFRILGGSTNLSGFVDTGVEPGSSYVYQFRTEVEVHGTTMLSDPVTRRVEVPFALQPVTDLSVQLHEEGHQPTFDLRWTAPKGGEARIFRTERPPMAGLTDRAISLGALDDAARLDADSWINRPVEDAGDGTVVMPGVPWPESWTRAYFTVVVVHGDEAFVGNTVNQVRTRPVTYPRVAERVGRKVVTFHWPEGADVVRAYVGGTGSTFDEVRDQTPAAEIDLDEYRHLGGMQLPGDGYLQDGATLHLVASMFDQGRSIDSSPVAVEVEPLLILGYRVQVKKSFLGRPTATVWPFARLGDFPQQMGFVLVYNRDHLPLTRHDGTPLSVVPDGDEGQAQPTPTFLAPALPSEANLASGYAWRVHQDTWDRTVDGGYLRVFVDLDPAWLRRVALVDPPMEELYLGAPTGGTGGTGWFGRGRRG